MTTEERVTQLTENSKDLFKKSIYDIISIAIIMAIVIISLDIFGIKDIDKNTLSTLFMEWMPFFLASMLLNSNQYEKGKYVGKHTKSYIAAMTQYSALADALTGEKLKYFSEFCHIKNEHVKKSKQELLLKSVGVSYNDFVKELQLTEEELEKIYNENTVKTILKARKVDIVGYKVNFILGNYNTFDETDLGPTEDELSKSYKIKSTVSNILSTILLTLLGIKDVMSWGWSGLLIVLFKAAYTFAKGYMAYFKGYNDVVIKLVNQVIRKCDIFKEYNFWFDTNKKSIGNNIEN